jgi:guanyl-specific ribonuclease Sa
MILKYLDGIKSGKLLCQADQLVETLERGGGAAGLHDHPTFGNEEGALAQDVGVHLQDCIGPLLRLVYVCDV